jgi:hypothetical protein
MQLLHSNFIIGFSLKAVLSQIKKLIDIIKFSKVKKTIKITKEKCASVYKKSTPFESQNI